jgi:hypothetical protein
LIGIVLFGITVAINRAVGITTTKLIDPEKLDS